MTAVDTVITYRKCTKCDSEKPASLEFFRKHPTTKIGLRSLCRSCENEYRRSAYARSDKKADQHKKTQYRKEYRRKNLEKIRRRERENSRKERELNREAVRARQKRWADENREHVRREKAVTEARRRARKRGAGGSVTSADIVRIAWEQSLQCFYCEDPLREFHADHFIPISRGGSSDPENIVAACPTCNMKKHSRLPWEWMPHRFGEGCSPR